MQHYTSNTSTTNLMQIMDLVFIFVVCFFSKIYCCVADWWCQIKGHHAPAVPATSLALDETGSASAEIRQDATHR